MRKPLVYVRKRPKGFGREAQIEGVIPKGARTLLVEDLMFDGKSKLHFCQALRDAGSIVDHIFAVFDYGVASSQAALAEAGVKSLCLTNWNVLLQVAVEDGLFTSDQARVVRAFLENPSGWSDSFLLRREITSTIRLAPDSRGNKSRTLATPHRASGSAGM